MKNELSYRLSTDWIDNNDDDDDDDNYDDDDDDNNDDKDDYSCNSVNLHGSKSR